VSVLVDSYSEANFVAGSFTGLYDTTTSHTYAAGQSFTGNGGILNSCKFYLSRYGAPTGYAVAKIYALTGTFGTNSKPTGAALATSDSLDISGVPAYANFGLATFTFSGANKIILTNGTKYVVVIEYSSGSYYANGLLVAWDGRPGTHAGNVSTYSTTNAWSYQATQDAIFYVYVNDPVTNHTSVAGTLNLGGGLTDKITARRILAGTLTLAGIANKKWIQLCFGILNLSGTFSGARIVYIAFDRTLNFTGDINRKITKTIERTLFTVGIISMKISKILAGTLIVGGVMNKLFRMIIVGTLIMSGIVLKKIKKIFTGTLIFTGILSAIKMLRYKIVSITIKCGTAVLDTLKLRRVR